MMCMKWQICRPQSTFSGSWCAHCRRQQRRVRLSEQSYPFSLDGQLALLLSFGLTELRKRAPRCAAYYLRCCGLQRLFAKSLRKSPN